jgi:hypothetical protein
MDFGSIHLEISSLAACTIIKISHNINTNELKELIFNSDSEEQCTSNVSDREHRTMMILLKQRNRHMIEKVKTGCSVASQCVSCR